MSNETVTVEYDVAVDDNSTVPTETKYKVCMFDTNPKHTYPVLAREFTPYAAAQNFVKRTLIGEGDLFGIDRIIIYKEFQDMNPIVCKIDVETYIPPE